MGDYEKKIIGVRVKSEILRFAQNDSHLQDPTLPSLYNSLIVISNEVRNLNL